MLSGGDLSCEIWLVVRRQKFTLRVIPWKIQKDLRVLRFWEIAEVAQCYLKSYQAMKSAGQAKTKVLVLTVNNFQRLTDSKTTHVSIRMMQAYLSLLLNLASNQQFVDTPRDFVKLNQSISRQLFQGSRLCMRFWAGWLHYVSNRVRFEKEKFSGIARVSWALACEGNS